MNIRKNIDYSEMYAALDAAMATDKDQMELYCEMGKAVSRRSEKGAAVMAAEYLKKQYPDVSGFSPRNVRRMRDFYRIYENNPALLSLAMQIGWTQNTVILEADLDMELREWYLNATKQFGWSKTELTEKIAANAHEEIVLAIEEDVCYIEEQEKQKATSENEVTGESMIRDLTERFRSRWRTKEGGLRRWPTMLCPISTAKPTAFMRC